MLHSLISTFKKFFVNPSTDVASNVFYTHTYYSVHGRAFIEFYDSMDHLTTSVFGFFGSSDIDVVKLFERFLLNKYGHDINLRASLIEELSEFSILYDKHAEYKKMLEYFKLHDNVYDIFHTYVEFGSLSTKHNTI